MYLPFTKFYLQIFLLSPNLKFIISSLLRSFAFVAKSMKIMKTDSLQMRVLLFRFYYIRVFHIPHLTSI